MANVVVPAEKKRFQVFKEMPAPLQEKARHFESLMGQGVRGTILIQYDMGAELLSIREDEGRYGSNATTQLANYLPIPGKTEESRRTALYALMGFVNSFDKKFVQEHSVRQMKQGGFLQLGHWLALSRIPEKDEQSRLLEKVIANSWSTNDLERELAAGAAKIRNKRSGGRNPKAPTSPIAGLQKLFDICQQLNRFEVVAEKSVFEALDEVDAEKVNKPLLERLEKTRDMAVQTGEKAQSAVERLDANIERVKEILDKKYSESEEKYSEEEDDGGEGKPRAKEGKKAKKVKVVSNGIPPGNGKAKGKKKKVKKATKEPKLVSAAEPD